MLVVSDRQFFILSDRGGRPRYYLGHTLPDIFYGKILSLDSLDNISFRECLINRKVINKVLNGYKTSFSSCSSSVELDNSKFLYLVSNTWLITEGSQRNYFHLLPVIFAGRLCFGNLVNKINDIDVYTEAIKVAGDISDQQLLDVIMSLNKEARLKFLYETIDYITLFKSKKVSKSTVEFKLINTSFRLVFQILLLDLGIVPSMRFSRQITTFRFPRSLLATSRTKKFKDSLDINKVRVLNREHILDRYTLYIDSVTNNLGNNLFCL